jgi:transposase
MDEVYSGIDLHSTNSVVAVIDGSGTLLYRKRLPNQIGAITAALAPYHDALQGVVVESTFNWYWLVDGLMAAGYRVRLANPTAIRVYSGLKHSDDDTDARWLAELLRLGILPTGYIYPAAERGVRDLLRKRAQLVRQRTANLLSLQNQVQRSRGVRVSGQLFKTLSDEGLAELMPHADVALAMGANLQVVHCLSEQIAALERTVLARVKMRREFRQLQSIPGVGTILALTIMLEVGAIARFASVGQFASYCRCVGSQRLSNGKKKGVGNVKSGNRYLAWAFLEAAQFARRYSEPIRRFHDRKAARTNAIVARKTVAHKLARAAYYIVRDQVAFDVTKGFC